MALYATPTVTRLGTSGQMTKRVQVGLQIQQSLPFSSIFMTAAPIITANATAASVPDGGEYCVVGLDPSAAATGIKISGSSYLDLGSCSLIANSTNPTAAASNGTSSTGGSSGSGSTVKAASIAAAGGVNFSSNWTVDSYNPYSSPVDDPFYAKKDLIPTSTAGCTSTGGSINGNNVTIDRTTDSASQVICLSGDQNIQGNVTLGAATYVIDGGNLSMNKTGASITCNGCTIIMTNFNNPAATGTVNLTGGSVNLLPPRSSTASDGTVTTIGNQNWKGIVLYQDPRATDNGNLSSPQNKINGNTDTSLQGAVYFGNQSVEFVGGGKDIAICLQVVAKRVTFSGNSKILAGSTCGGYGLSAIGGSRRVRLVG